MRKLLTTFTVAAICLGGGIALASTPNTPIIHMPMHKQLNAHSTLGLELSRYELISGVQYDISCHVINKNYADPKNIVMLKLDGDLSAIRVNGVAVNPQFRVPLQDNVVQFKVVSSGNNKVTVLNLDQDESVILENCSAIPTT